MSDHYRSLWRTSAYEAVPHTKDFPEALLVLPEAFDGSIGQGNATKINITIRLNQDGPSILGIKDNGIGIQNERRLLGWSAHKSTDNMHRNGHGLKKFMTKWNSDYDSEWSIRYRKKGKNVNILEGPFNGQETKSYENETDCCALMPSGTEINFKFNRNVLTTENNIYNDAEGLYKGIKELIQTRYSETILRKTEFIIDIECNDYSKIVHINQRSSFTIGSEWHSFQFSVENNSSYQKQYSNNINIDGGYYTLDIYKADTKGVTTLKKEFNIYGGKSINDQRVHIGLNGRIIEPIELCQMLGMTGHNDYNGWLSFVNFIPNTDDLCDLEKLPIPCTTKVSLYRNNPAFIEFKRNFTEIYTNVYKTTKKSLINPTPLPKQAPAQLTLTTQVILPAVTVIKPLLDTTPDITTTPASAQAKPVSAQTKPVSAQTKPVSAQTKPASAQRKIVIKKTVLTIETGLIYLEKWKSSNNNIIELGNIVDNMIAGYQKEKFGNTSSAPINDILQLLDFESKFKVLISIIQRKYPNKLNYSTTLMLCGSDLDKEYKKFNINE